MENPKIIEIICNFGGKRFYEEKKTSKLGYPSLYEYNEDKINKEIQDNQLQQQQKLKTTQKNALVVTN